jgi:thiamine pyrophosphate-dependent acetolactate synthase large subunit-like protein
VPAKAVVRVDDLDAALDEAFGSTTPFLLEVSVEPGS